MDSNPKNASGNKDAPSSWLRTVLSVEGLRGETATAVASLIGRLQRDPAMADGVRNRRRAAIHGQLAKDVAQVNLHGLGADMECLGDFLVGMSRCRGPQHVHLAVCEVFGGPDLTSRQVSDYSCH